MAKKQPTQTTVKTQERLIIAGLRDGLSEDAIREAFGWPDWTWSRRFTRALDENAAALAADPCSCNVHP